MDPLPFPSHYATLSLHCVDCSLLLALAVAPSPHCLHRLHCSALTLAVCVVADGSTAHFSSPPLLLALVLVVSPSSSPFIPVASCLYLEIAVSAIVLFNSSSSSLFVSAASLPPSPSELFGRQHFDEENDLVQHVRSVHVAVE
ncbi:hypothetical protein PIB30_032740 [Stylosanthes scabra]|uniref:Uncharacterized protein n=1 Tax=Stylosanthes scabra TaxID=79078 RepID=A0ABU6TD11_9FABA|nr:hypothetical protein [Stylosanthes scabra]